MPLADARDGDWVKGVVATLVAASDAVASATGRLSRFMRLSSPRAARGRELGVELAERLPVNSATSSPRPQNSLKETTQSDGRTGRAACST